MGDVQNIGCVQNIAADKAKELLPKMLCPVNLNEKSRVKVLNKDLGPAQLNALTLHGASEPVCIILFEVIPSRRCATLLCQLLLVNDLDAPHVAQKFIYHCIRKHAAGRVEVKVIYHDPTLTFRPRPCPLI